MKCTQVFYVIGEISFVIFYQALTSFLEVATKQQALTPEVEKVLEGGNVRNKSYMETLALEVWIFHYLAQVPLQ